MAGPAFNVYGGNTICIEVRCGSDVLLFDAGTGIIPAGVDLLSRAVKTVSLFLTHSHYDHIQGLPFFAPLHKPDTTVAIASAHLEGVMTTYDVIKGVMRPPYFPVGPEIFKAAVDYRDFLPGDVLEPGAGITVRTGRLQHPGGSTGYRIEYAGRVVAIVTDTEHTPGELDEKVLKLIEGADLFLYDSAFCDEEMAKYQGFGHSSWQHAIRLAEAAKVKAIGLMHHSPFHTDQDLERIARLAAERFSEAQVVKDGQVFGV
ncbi:MULTISPECIES: MBL fold metallo-hydrolase [unclassified Rhizobium]|uniref:MBL fold metallo-hydrolase n=1 Tax=unclassified Rhizobium TaxID=2613769 RepID=UPI001FCD8A12|nr:MULTISPECIES: MBL fold metallo-hydrolase [unclassified Rhizobium]